MSKDISLSILTLGLIVLLVASVTLNVVIYYRQDKIQKQLLIAESRLIAEVKEFNTLFTMDSKNKFTEVKAFKQATTIAQIYGILYEDLLSQLSPEQQQQYAESTGVIYKPKTEVQ